MDGLLFHLLLPALYAVLELGKAEEHLLQGYLAHAVIFNAVFLLGCLQSAKHLSGSRGHGGSVR